MMMGLALKARFFIRFKFHKNMAFTKKRKSEINLNKVNLTTLNQRIVKLEIQIKQLQAKILKAKNRKD